MTMITTITQIGSVWLRSVLAPRRRKPLISLLTVTNRSQQPIQLTSPTLVDDLQALQEDFHTVYVAVLNKANSWFSQDHFLRWTGAARQEQLSQMLSAADAQANRQIHQQANLEMGAGIAATALAGIGAFGMPALGMLSVPFCVYAAGGPIKRSLQKLRHGETTTDLLVTLSVAGSLGCGYFFAAGLSALVFRIGSKLELAVKDHSKQNLIDAFRQHAVTVWVLVDGVEVERPFTALQKGDVVVVHAGETVPVDGVILEGAAAVDQRILTGEARPVEKMAGDALFAATLLLTGRVALRVEKTGLETTAGQISEILNKTVSFKSTVQLRGQEMADRTVLPTLLLSVGTGALLGVESGIAVLFAHFRNRISAVVPVSLLHFLNQAAQAQILIKDGRSLDLLQQVDILVFDKTGTLTTEQPHVYAIHAVACEQTHPGEQETAVLTYAAAAEYKQTHPIARAILATAAARHLSVPELDHATYKVGYGLMVQVHGQQVRVGSTNFMTTEGLVIPASLQTAQTQAHEEGHTLVLVAVGEAVIGGIELAPTIRPEAKAVIQQLRQRRQIKATYIISGDAAQPTQKLARELGIDHAFAEVLPEKKANIIAQLQAEGKSICYVGDGINDVIALKKAQVSISLRGAATVATDTAQIILMEQSLRRLPYLFTLADEFNHNVTQCLTVMLSITGLSLGSIFIFHAGIPAAITFLQVNLFASMATALLPRWRQQTLPEADDADGASAP